MNKLITLLTIPKSGTNYFRIFIYNYLNLLLNNTPGGYDEMANSFPNSLTHYARNEENKISFPLRKFGFDDFVYQHGLSNRKYLLDCTEGPIVCLYRNPLDYLVSAYYYFYKSRLNTKDHFFHPYEIVEERLPHFVRIYSGFMSLNENYPQRVLMVNYEDIFEFPFDSFSNILKNLSLPVNYIAIEQAINASNFNKMVDYENKHGPLHARDKKEVIKSRISGYRFVRKGSVGQ